MPVSKINQRKRLHRKRYPADWPEWRIRIRERSGGRCECVGECGRHTFERCVEVHGEEGKTMRGLVQLQVAHRNHHPEDCRDENLSDFCQGCHLGYDRDHHATSARLTRNKVKGQIDLVDELAIQQTVKILLADLENRPMSVGLVDAPDPAYNGHKVRAVFSRPPDWYMRISASFGYSRKGQGLFHRYLFMKAMKRIQASNYTSTRYTDIIMNTIRLAIEKPEEVFTR